MPPRTITQQKTIKTIQAALSFVIEMNEKKSLRLSYTLMLARRREKHKTRILFKSVFEVEKHKKDEKNEGRRRDENSMGSITIRTCTTVDI